MTMTYEEFFAQQAKRDAAFKEEVRRKFAKVPRAPYYAADWQPGIVRRGKGEPRCYADLLFYAGKRRPR